METGALGRGKRMVVSDLLLRGLCYQQVEIIHGKWDVINETLNCTVKIPHTSEIWALVQSWVNILVII